VQLIRRSDGHVVCEDDARCADTHGVVVNSPYAVTAICQLDGELLSLEQVILAAVGGLWRRVVLVHGHAQDAGPERAGQPSEVLPRLGPIPLAEGGALVLRQVVLVRHLQRQHACVRDIVDDEILERIVDILVVGGHHGELVGVCVPVEHPDPSALQKVGSDAELQSAEDLLPRVG